MLSSRRRFAALAVGLLVAAGIVGVALLDGDEPDGAPQPEGQAPSDVSEVQLVGIDGQPEGSLADLRGRPVVLNFFASWCVPCVDEMPAFEAVHQDLGDRVAIVGVAERDRPEDARRIVAQTGITYPAYRDGDGSMLGFFGGVIMPTTVFVDREGQVVDRHSGELDEKALRHRIAELFEVEA